MDKKNTLLGVIFLVAAFAVMALMNKNTKDVPQPERIPPVSESTPPGTGAESQTVTPVKAPPVSEAVSEIVDSVAPTESIPEELSYLENELIEVIFTNQGGGIKKVALKEYAATKNSDDPYLFNHYGYAPMLGVSTGDGAFDKPFRKV